MAPKDGALPPIRVTIEIPSELALEMQRVATKATIEGAGQAQAHIMDAWMRIGAQVMESWGSTYSKALQISGPGKKTLRDE